MGTKLCLSEVKKFLEELIEKDIDKDIEYGESEKLILEKIDVLVNILNSGSIEEAVEHFIKLAGDLDVLHDALEEFNGTKICEQILMRVVID